MRATMPSCSNWRSCWISIFCEMPGDGSFEFGEAQRLATEEVEKYDELPAPLQHLNGFFNAAGRRSGRVMIMLTQR